LPAKGTRKSSGAHLGSGSSSLRSLLSFKASSDLTPVFAGTPRHVLLDLGLVGIAAGRRRKLNEARDCRVSLRLFEHSDANAKI